MSTLQILRFNAAANFTLLSYKLECEMLRKSFLSMINDTLLKRNKYIMDITCLSVSSRSTHVDSEEAKNTNIEKLNNGKKIEKIKLNIIKMEGRSTNKDEKHDFVEYLSNNLSPEIANICSNIFVKPDKCGNNSLCLVDSRVAAEFSSLIMNDLSRDMCFVAELNPGIGILTTELLKGGVPLIHLYEERKEFDSVLKNLSNIYSGRLNRKRFNLLKINTLMYLDKITNKDEVVKAFQGVESKKWRDECMQVIGATNTTNFIRHITYSLLFRNSYMTYGRTVFYMAISPTIWHKYACDNKQKYTTIKVLFQLMFDYKLLGKLKRKAFLPWPKKRKKKRTSQEAKILEEMNYNDMFVVKLEPKIDMYSRMSQKDWIKFWYFVRHTIRKPSNRVISEIEKWIPGSGVRIIAQCDYTIFTEFGDLMPEEFLKLFKEFQSWPEYETSNFLNAMEDSLNTFNEPAILNLSTKDDNMNDYDDMHD